MRTLLSLAAILTSFQTTSDACGWVPPRLSIHRVTWHTGQRAFAVLGDAPLVADTDWSQLAPSTYDNTEVAELSPVAAHELTLVGATDTRVVSARHQVALRHGWQLGDGGPHAALEVPAAGFTLAIDGKLPDAKWHAMQFTYTHTQHIRDLALDVTLADGGYTISSSGKVLTSGQGSVLGMLDADHQRFVVVEQTRGDLRAVYFGGV
jgi:hypothetical protein